jgi:argininosuccinate lyase
LGFERVLINPQYAQNARGKVELRALDALAAATGDLRRVSWDLGLFASQEFNFVEIPAQFCTGSSIMPNKLNPDTVELLRSLHALIVGARMELEAVLSLPSGYHRDLQDTKAPLIRAFERGLSGLALLTPLLRGLVWHPDRMHSAVAPELHATDRANELVGEGRAFREAYRVAAAELDQLGQRRPLDSLAARCSLGGCASLGLDRLQQRLSELTPEL